MMLTKKRIWPSFCVFWSSEYRDKYIEREMKQRDKNIPGNVLSMVQRRPRLSMKKMATIFPKAFVVARGILRRIPVLSRSSSPSIVIPESIIIYGP